MVLAQSLCAASDLIVLRWLDYLGIIDIVNGVEDLVEKGEAVLADLIDKCLGKDVIQEKVIAWIEDRMGGAGYDPDDIVMFTHRRSILTLASPPIS